MMNTLGHAIKSVRCGCPPANLTLTKQASHPESDRWSATLDGFIACNLTSTGPVNYKDYF